MLLDKRSGQQPSTNLWPPSFALFAYSAGRDLRNKRELKQSTISGMVGESYDGFL